MAQVTGAANHTSHTGPHRRSVSQQVIQMIAHNILHYGEVNALVSVYENVSETCHGVERLCQP